MRTSHLCHSLLVLSRKLILSGHHKNYNGAVPKLGTETLRIWRGSGLSYVRLSTAREFSRVSADLGFYNRGYFIIMRARQVKLAYKLEYKL